MFVDLREHRRKPRRSGRARASRQRERGGAREGTLEQCSSVHAAESIREQIARNPHRDG
jgi:hypothetical protein